MFSEQVHGKVALDGTLVRTTVAVVMQGPSTGAGWRVAPPTWADGLVGHPIEAGWWMETPPEVGVEEPPTETGGQAPSHIAAGRRVVSGAVVGLAVHHVAGAVGEPPTEADVVEAD